MNDIPMATESDNNAWDNFCRGVAPLVQILIALAVIFFLLLLISEVPSDPQAQGWEDRTRG